MSEQNTQKLSYEEWREQVAPFISVDDEVRQQFSESFDADINDELDEVFRHLYEHYLAQE